MRPDLPYTVHPTITRGPDGRWRDEDGYLLHRVDGPTIVAGGGEMWYLDGRQHRADGPATITPSGCRVWCWEGHVHRVDGPAVEDPMSGRAQWWFQGECYPWFLTGALFAHDAARQVLVAYRRADRQRWRALALLPALAPALRAQTVAEALASTDAELRRWGQQALALAGHVDATGGEDRPGAEGRHDR